MHPAFLQSDRLYSHHDLSRLDDHTLGCKAAGISYIPIPPGVDSNHAGLMTIDVPATVRKGQLFKVVTRQITNTFSVAPEPQTPPEIAVVPSVAATAGVIKWRKVLGSFQLTIPVQTKEALREPEERLLSVLRWISGSIPHGNRWHPVFRRYLEQTAGRVDALGGDSSQASPSSSGDWKARSRCKTWGRFCRSTPRRFVSVPWVAHWNRSRCGTASVSSDPGSGCGCVVQEVPSHIVRLAARVPGRRRIGSRDTGHPDPRWNCGFATDTVSVCFDYLVSNRVPIGSLQDMKDLGFLSAILKNENPWHE